MPRKALKVHQHETLRVPASWNEQDRALIIQMERILDDLYEKIGEIGWKNLSDALKNSIVTDVAYNEDTHQLTVTIGGAPSDVVAIPTKADFMPLTWGDLAGI